MPRVFKGFGGEYSKEKYAGYGMITSMLPSG
jgi:hypothetical protein